jgi:hypothetical protein
VRIKCGAAKRVRVKARCVMRERDVNFGAFLNFLPLAEYCTVVGDPKE